MIPTLTLGPGPFRRVGEFAAITAREASIVAALADAAAAPEPPLPPVAATDAAAAFDSWLDAGPRRNRLALRAGLLALERASGRRRFRTRDRAGRLRALRRLQHARVPVVPPLAEALRSAAVVSYHGDARVMAAPRARRTCTSTRAERILMRGARATGVEARTAAGGRLTVIADAVVVAAGAIHTPLLLAANGLGRGSGRLGRNLSLHPATAIWGVFEEDVDMVRGVPQSYFVDEFARDGIVLEGIAGPPDYLAMSAPLTGDAHRELMLRYRHVAQCGLMISDTARGHVRGRPRAPLIRYDLARADVATIHTGLVRLAELLQAAGAHTLHLPLARLPELPRADPAPLRALPLARRDLKLMAFHPLGTARAHADPAQGVVDGDLRLHGAENVYVADGSAVPSALGVNPQITIMALATRLAFHLRGATCPS